MKHNAHPFKQLLVLIGSHIGMLSAMAPQWQRLNNLGCCIGFQRHYVQQEPW